MQESRYEGKDSSAQARMDALHLANEVCYLNCHSYRLHCGMQSVSSFYRINIHRLPMLRLACVQLTGAEAVTEQQLVCQK